MTSVSDIPTGAIENGRVFLQRLADHYDFTCEAGSLANCTDYHEAVRCFEFIAQWISDLSTLEPSAARELHGPFGHIVGRRDLQEDEWSLENDPVNEDDAAKGFFSVPLYALTDPFKEIGIDGRSNAASPAARELALEEAAQVAEDYVQYDVAAAIRALSSPGHADDLAVDRFAIAMKQKLAKKREEGRGGWENKDECSAEYLSYLLIQHIWKGDPVDIANLAMMLQQRGERVVIDSETSSIIPDHADAGKVEGDGWMPIESAPKDGTRILAAGMRQGPAIEIVSYGSFGPYNRSTKEYAKGWSCIPGHLLAPTHWRPLPTPPSSEVA